MALFRCEVKTISRGQGRSICAAAAYRAGVAIPDERQQMTHNYGRKGGIEHAEILAPEGAPEWVHDRVQLWNRVDAAEKRKDAMTAREVLLTLPRELTSDQQRKLVRDFVKAELTSKGLAVDASYHAPDAYDKEPNFHVHLLWSDRAIGLEGLASTKDRTYARPEGIEGLRVAWAELVNRALEAAGRTERVDHRSLRDQHLAAVEAGDEIEAGRVGRLPETKIGPQATAMERCGRRAHAFDEAHAIRLDAHGRNEAARMLREVVEQIAALEAEEKREGITRREEIARSATRSLRDALVEHREVARTAAGVGRPVGNPIEGRKKPKRRPAWAATTAAEIAQKVAAAPAKPPPATRPEPPVVASLPPVPVAPPAARKPFVVPNGADQQGVAAIVAATPPEVLVSVRKAGEAYLKLTRAIPAAGMTEEMRDRQVETRRGVERGLEVLEKEMRNRDRRRVAELVEVAPPPATRPEPQAPVPQVTIREIPIDDEPATALKPPKPDFQWEISPPGRARDPLTR